MPSVPYLISLFAISILSFQGEGIVDGLIALSLSFVPFSLALS